MTVVSLKGPTMSNHRGRNHKPSQPRRIPDPAEAARRGIPSEWGVNESALELAANADIETKQDRSVEGKRRVRYDIFALLYYRPGSKLSTPAYDAVRRLQSDMAVLHRTQGATDAIRASGVGQTGALAVVSENFSLTRVLAGERVDDALAAMTAWCAKLIRELCEVEVIRGQTPNWQAIVSKHTGERRHLAKYDHVRTAANDLAESYRRIDNEPRERVA